MLESLDKLVRILMTAAYPVGGKDVVTLHVLHFLNSFESFKPLTEDRKFPEWLTMYNFLCLLNLPDAIAELGPLRFNYEGSTEGEGFIPMVKPLLSQGMRKNWQKNLAHRFFRKRAMKLVIRDAHLFIGNTDDAGGGTGTPYQKKMFHKYKRWEQVQGHFSKGLPISLVVLRDGFLGAVVDDRESWLLVPVRLMDWVGCNVGLEYFRVMLFERGLNGTITRNVVNIGRVADVIGFVMMLPWLKEEKYVDSDTVSWTIVGAEYERLSRGGSLQTVYNLPINLQNQDNGSVPIDNAPAGTPDGVTDYANEGDELYDLFQIASV
jgi:hypothetical protein